MRYSVSFIVVLALLPLARSFVSPVGLKSLSGSSRKRSSWEASTSLKAQISKKDAQAAIDKVVQALRKDGKANEELGKLDQVTAILGYGSPNSGTYAVRFNASFKKGGFGLSAIPLPFGLGQTNQSEGRGTMVGQVKASVDAKSGKVTSCSVFRDLGYGRAFNLQV